MADCPHRHITRWITCVSGFLRDRSRITGTVRLWLDLSQHRDAQTETLLLNWSDDPREYASLIWAASQEMSDYPQVYAIGYSWGGQTALNFCRELGRRGIPVEAVVLADAVYRHWWMFRRWTSLVRWKALYVPSNVRQVWWYRQRQVMPMGHDVLPESTRHTLVHEPVTLDVDHSYLDDHPEFHRHCHALLSGEAAA